MNVCLQRLRPIEYGSHTNFQELQGSLTNLQGTQGYVADRSDSSQMALRERTFSLPDSGTVPQFGVKSQDVPSLTNTPSVTGISVGLNNHGRSNVARPAEMVALTGRW